MDASWTMRFPERRNGIDVELMSSSARRVPGDARAAGCSGPPLNASMRRARPTPSRSPRALGRSLPCASSCRARARTGRRRVEEPKGEPRCEPMPAVELPRDFRELAKRSGAPQIPGLKIVYLHPLGSTGGRQQVAEHHRASDRRARRLGQEHGAGAGEEPDQAGRDRFGSRPTARFIGRRPRT